MGEFDISWIVGIFFFFLFVSVRLFELRIITRTRSFSFATTPFVFSLGFRDNVLLRTSQFKRVNVPERFLIFLLFFFLFKNGYTVFIFHVLLLTLIIRPSVDCDGSTVFNGCSPIDRHFSSLLLRHIVTYIISMLRNTFNKPNPFRSLFATTSISLFFLFSFLIIPLSCSFLSFFVVFCFDTYNDNCNNCNNESNVCVCASARESLIIRDF